MKIVYKLLAIYTLFFASFLLFITLPFLDFSEVSYTWNKWRYILGEFHFIPVVVFALWSIFKKENKTV